MRTNLAFKYSSMELSMSSLMSMKQRCRGCAITLLPCELLVEVIINDAEAVSQNMPYLIIFVHGKKHLAEVFAMQHYGPASPL